MNKLPLALWMLLFPFEETVELYLRTLATGKPAWPMSGDDALGTVVIWLLGGLVLYPWRHP